LFDTLSLHDALPISSKGSGRPSSRVLREDHSPLGENKYQRNKPFFILKDMFVIAY
jgi:hypothetical protein